jgi:hypothetical protein
METLRVYGLIWLAVVEGPGNEGLRRLVCELRRPCAPGAVRRFVREALRGSDVGFILELVVSEGLKDWLGEELAEVGEKGSFRGSLKVHMKKPQTTREDYCDEWVKRLI